MWRRPVLSLILVLAGCGEPTTTPPAPPGAEPPNPAYPPGAPFVDWFHDVTREAGLAATPTSGFGVAVGDVDGDGRLDLLVGGNKTLLYHNLGALRFEDITVAAGIALDFPSQGVALGDVDGDGDADAIVTGPVGTRFYRNRGGGVFADETEAAGLAGVGSAVGVLLTDFDDDGLVDLYFPRYGLGQGISTTGIPDTQDRVYRNRGDGSFEDVTARFGGDRNGATFVVARFDFDGDGDLDLFVGNDTHVIDWGDRQTPPSSADLAPDLLLRNDGIGANGLPVWTEIGAATGARGYRSTMGVLAADLTGDGRTDLYISNYGRKDLLAGRSDGSFVDATDAMGVGATRRLDADCAPDSQRDDCALVSWGSAYEDFDNDGLGDLVVVNASLYSADARQPAAVWRGEAPGRLAPVQTSLGWMGGYGLLAVDLDDDGDLDLVVATQDGPVRLFRNDAPTNPRAWLRVRLQGRRSNREGLGAEIRATLSNGRVLVRRIGTGGVVYSWPAAEAHFGTGGADVSRLEVRWPSGIVQNVGAVASGQILTVVEAQ